MSDYRKIVADRVGRPLTRNDVVHHANGNHHDDRPGNLLLTTHEGHRRIHGAMRGRKRAWLTSAAYRWVYPPLGYTHDETVELTHCTSPRVLAEIGEIEAVQLDEWQRGFTIPSVDAFVARGGLRSLRVQAVS